MQIEVDGRRIGVTAEQLHGAERTRAWQQIAAAAPRFAQYQDTGHLVLWEQPERVASDLAAFVDGLA